MAVFTSSILLLIHCSRRLSMTVLSVHERLQTNEYIIIDIKSLLLRGSFFMNIITSTRTIWHVQVNKHEESMTILQPVCLPYTCVYGHRCYVLLHTMYILHAELTALSCCYCKYKPAVTRVTPTVSFGIQILHCWANEWHQSTSLNGVPYASCTIIITP